MGIKRVKKLSVFRIGNNLRRHMVILKVLVQYANHGAVEDTNFTTV